MIVGLAHRTPSYAHAVVPYKRFCPEAQGESRKAREEIQGELGIVLVRVNVCRGTSAIVGGG